MHRGHIGDGGCAAGADRPDRLVGDRQPVARSALRQRGGELRGDDRLRPTRVALGRRLAHAQDRVEPDGARGLRLGPDLRVGLALVGAAFGMAHDRETRADLLDHRRRDAAGMRAARGLMHVLSADHERGRAVGRKLDQRGGHGDRDVHPR